MKLFSLILSLGFFQLGYSIEHIDSTSVSSKPQQFSQEYKTDTMTCHDFLQPYTRLMKEGYKQVHEAGKNLKEESFRRDLPEKEHTQILIKKIGILGYHINYLENIMGTIESSYCFDNVNSTLKRINISFLFAKTRTSLRDFSNKISKGLQELEEKPSSLKVFDLLSSIFNGDSYDAMDKDINLCLQIFETYLENQGS